MISSPSPWDYPDLVVNACEVRIERRSEYGQGSPLIGSLSIDQHAVFPGRLVGGPIVNDDSMIAMPIRIRSALVWRFGILLIDLAEMIYTKASIRREFIWLVELRRSELVRFYESWDSSIEPTVVALNVEQKEKWKEIPTASELV